MTPKENVNEIRVSVLVPVFNVERYLEECIESVINQSVPAFEVILVDDGSTDGSGRICEEYSNRYEFIKTYHKENQGQLSARLYAINKAKGDWLVFLDSDDTLKRYAIEKIKEIIVQYSPDCIIYGLDRVKEGKVLQPFEPEINEERLIIEKSELYEIVFTHSALNSLCRKAVRKELLSNDYTQYYQISLAEDLLQSIEIYKKGKNFFFIPEALYNYRFNEKSITNTVRFQDYKVDFTVREKVKAFLQEENVFNNLQWEVYNDYSLKIFIEQIKTILTLNATSDVITELLDKVRSSAYYETYISKINRKGTWLEKVLLSSLLDRKYFKLLIINKVYNIKKRII